MAAGNIVTQGIGLNPNTIKFIVTRGMGEGIDTGEPDEVRWHTVTSNTTTWSKQSKAY